MSNQILDNIAAVERRIQKACDECGRNADDIKLLLATKTVSAENIKIALQSGQTLIAENKIQELQRKYDELRDIPHTNHFIGHLQSNKIATLLKYNVTCIQSIDRVALGEKLHKRLVFENRKMDIFIQVNTSMEQSKFGVDPKNAISLVSDLALLPTLKIKGLMTIGIFSRDQEKVQTCFRLLKCLQQLIIAQNIENVEMNELSMGMSEDLELAIKEGATIVRVGTAIFGKRPTPDHYYWNENNHRQ